MDTTPKYASLLKILGLILLTLILVLIAWGFYNFEYRQSPSILKTLKLNVEMITHLNAEQQEMQQKMAALQTALNDSTPWKIRQATEWVIQADIQLHTQPYREKAVYFLTSAKILLDKVDPTTVASLKQALTATIAQLKQTKPVPLNEINKILIKNQRVLPSLIFTAAPNLLSDDSEQNPTPQNGWRSALHSFLNKFKKFVVIRKTEAPLLPLISKDMQFLAEQHLSTLLTQTQGAAALQQNQIYQENLQQILWLVQHYYDLKNQQTKGFISDLTALQKINVQPGLPDLAPVISLFIAANG